MTLRSPNRLVSLVVAAVLLAATGPAQAAGPGPDPNPAAGFFAVVEEAWKQLAQPVLRLVGASEEGGSTSPDGSTATVGDGGLNLDTEHGPGVDPDG